MMRKPDKPALRKIIMPDEKSIQKAALPDIKGFVLDGGALLHRVRWNRGKTFYEVAQAYYKYIDKNYEADRLVIVFDGYDKELIKSHEHMRRNLIPESCDVIISAETKVPFTQDRLLSNTENKSSFIKFLSSKLQEWNVNVVNCPGDADSTIVKTALQYAKNLRKTIAVVADDTDIAVMLVHHWKEEYGDVYFLQERWDRAWSVRDSARSNENTKAHLLFLHAFSGCDTTSAVHGKGKTQLFKICETSKVIQELSEVICSPWSDQEQVGDASITLFKLLYAGDEKDTLKRLRFVYFLYYLDKLPVINSSYDFNFQFFVHYIAYFIKNNQTLSFFLY